VTAKKTSSLKASDPLAQAKQALRAAKAQLKEARRDYKAAKKAAKASRRARKKAQQTKQGKPAKKPATKGRGSMKAAVKAGPQPVVNAAPKRPAKRKTRSRTATPAPETRSTAEVTKTVIERLQSPPPALPPDPVIPQD
jgi:hypothetical protein